MEIPNRLADNAQVNHQSSNDSSVPFNWLNDEIEKRMLIEQQSVLLLHAGICQLREQTQQKLNSLINKAETLIKCTVPHCATMKQHQQTLNSLINATEPVSECTKPHCATMKQLLNHVMNCSDGKQCTVPHCASSKQITKNWENYFGTDCTPFNDARDHHHSSDHRPVPENLPNWNDEERKLARQQLVWMSHANDCKEREQKQRRNRAEPISHCTLPGCATMRQILVHCGNCTRSSGQQCPVPHCASTKQIMLHRENCSSTDCNVCLPLIDRDNDRESTPQTQQNELADDAQVNHQSESEQFINYCLKSDTEKPRLIQYFALLLHANKCLLSEHEPSLNGTERIGTKCFLRNFSSRKHVLAHLANCSAGQQDCPFPHCFSSRQIIAHYENCPRTDCPVCVPLIKENVIGKDRKQFRATLSHERVRDVSYLQKAYQSAFLPYKEYKELRPNQQQTIDTLNVDSQQTQQTKQLPKAGQCRVNSDLRKHLVQNIVETLFPPINSKLPQQHRRMSNLFIFAQKVECEMYEKANTREAYYHLIQEKVYEIQKEIIEKMQKRKHERQLQSRANPNLDDSGNLQQNSPMLEEIASLPDLSLPQLVVETVSDLRAQLDDMKTEQCET